MLSHWRRYIIYNYCRGLFGDSTYDRELLKTSIFPTGEASPLVALCRFVLGSPFAREN